LTPCSEAKRLLDPAIRIELAAIYNQTSQVDAAIGELVGGLDDLTAPQLPQMLESLYTSQPRQ
jgi:hypothetical protein